MWASDLASKIDARMLGNDIAFFSVASLLDATAEDISFIIWPKDINKAKRSKASVLITNIDVAADYAHELSATAILVISHWPKVFMVLAELIAQSIIKTHFKPASIRVGKDTKISEHALLSKHAFIGERCQILAGVIIHDNVIIGNDCIIGANSVIGSFPFIPYFLDHQQRLLPLGFVIIKNHVTIGALCSVDRGLIGPTMIDDYSMLDNMVHIAHDVKIGSNVTIAAQSGLAGLVNVQDNVCINGQVGVAPLINIGKGAQINGKSLVHCDIKDYEIWSGNPAMAHFTYLRAYSYLKRKFARKINE